jgi:hypothetical protein
MKDKPKRMPYPIPIETHAGCKVAWNFYDDKAKADECAKAAVHNAEIALAQGYDFGYQRPGNVDYNPTLKQYRVCLP